MVECERQSRGAINSIRPLPSNLTRTYAYPDLSHTSDLQNTGGIVRGTISGLGLAPVRTGLPAKNGPLSSSIGSIATTIVDKVGDDPEECGRVAGWVASFDKLLADTLGVHTLLVSGREEGRRGLGGWVWVWEGKGGGCGRGGVQEGGGVPGIQHEHRGRGVYVRAVGKVGHEKEINVERES